MAGSKTKIAIGIALLFHLSGLIGMMTSSRPWFISMTPLTLLLMFGLMVWTEERRTSRFYIFSAIAFVVGMLVETIGVNTALLFGHYTYGSAMGYKVFGVPWLIGIQWLVTIYCSSQLLYSILAKRTIRLGPIPFSALAALLTTLFDVVLEPVAMKFDYWNWDNGTIPFYNYSCWFLISFLLHWIKLRFFKQEESNKFASILFVIQVLFFLALWMVL